MQLQLLKNTKIDYKNKIAGGIEQLELYLKSYESGYDESWSTIEIFNNKKISQYSVSITLENGFADFNPDLIIEYDAVIINDYPYLRNQKSFWLIQNKNFNSEKNWTFDLEIDLLSTFGLDKLDISKPIKFARKHIRDLDNFKNYKDKLLTEDHFYKNTQPGMAFDTFSLLKKEFIYNENEKKTEERIGTKYWAVYAFNGSVAGDVEGESIYLHNNFVFDDNKNIHIGSPILYLVTPWVSKHFFFPGGDSLPPVSTPLRLWGRELIDNDEGVNSISIVDFQPYNLFEITDEGDGSLEDPFHIINNKADSEPDTIITSSEGDTEAIGVTPNYISQSNTTTTYKSSENLFDFEIADNYFENDTKDLWNEKQVLAMEFPPFKYFELNFSSETPFSRNLFDYSDMDRLITKDSEFLERRYDFSTPILGVNDKILNKTTGQSNFGLRRDFTPPRATNTWKEYNRQKVNRSMTDFGLPIGAAATGAIAGSVVPGVGTAVGAGVGAAVGIATKTGKTILKRQSIKNTPDTITEASIDFANVLLKGLDTKGIYIHTPIASQKTSIAYELHKWGSYFHEMGKKFKSIKDILPKTRFNYLELSSSEDTNITKNIDRIYSLIYIGQLMGGITFWEFGNSSTDKYLFNYNYKNPDKEGILEQNNTIKFVIPAGYTANIKQKSSVSEDKYRNTTIQGMAETGGEGNGYSDNWSIFLVPGDRDVGSAYAITSSSDGSADRRINTHLGYNHGILFSLPESQSSDTTLTLVGPLNPDDFELETTAATYKESKKEYKALKKEYKNKVKNNTKIIPMMKKELTQEQKEALNEKTKIKGGR